MSMRQGARTLNLCLDIIDGVGRLHLKGDCLAREGLHENLHGDLGKVSHYSHQPVRFEMAYLSSARRLRL
jgi:hypothetical protein